MLHTHITFILIAGSLFLVISLALLHSTIALSAESVPHQQRDRKLHLLLPLNSGVGTNSPHFCKTLFSAIVHGYEPTVVNWDRQGNWKDMQRGKVYGVHEYLTNITDPNEDTDVVFMMDAIDIWLQLSPRTLIQRFEELNTSGVVAGADKICYPNDPESTVCKGAPPSTLPKGVYRPNQEPRWANSGTVIGSVEAMRTLYTDLVKGLDSPEWQNSPMTCDQGIFNEFLAAGRLSLDYRARLFWPMDFTNPVEDSHIISAPYHIDDIIPHELYPPVLFQAITGEVPVAVHFNHYKELRDDWWGKLWWNSLQNDDGERFRDIVSSRMEGAVIRFAGIGSKEWRDICPEEFTGI